MSVVSSCVVSGVCFSLLVLRVCVCVYVGAGVCFYFIFVSRYACILSVVL